MRSIRRVALGLCIAGCVGLTACSAPDDAPPPRAQHEPAATGPTESSAVPSSRPTSGEVLRAIRTTLQASSPRMADDITWTFDDLTIEEMWSELGIVVVQLTSQPRQSATFMVRDGVAQELGKHFGAGGVHSLAVADVNGDEHLDLAYGFRWGSGITRSELAWLDLTSTPPVEHNLGVSGYIGPLLVSTDEHGRVAVTLDDVLRGHYAFADGQTTLEFVDGQTPESVFGSR